MSYLFRKKYTSGENPNTDRLYRNDFSDSLNHPVFTNVSVEAGIQTEGFGLGINITDINQDGWKDIYVTNDYVTNDLIYINTLSFGRKAVVIVESDLAGTLVKEALSAQLKGNKLADKERAVLANCNYHVAFLGGGRTDLDFNAGQPLQQLINYIDTTLDVDNYGDPIAYKAAYLKNHQIFYNSY